MGIDKLFYKLKDQGISKYRIRKFLAKQEVYQTTKKRTGYQNVESFIPTHPKQFYVSCSLLVKLRNRNIKWT